MHAPVAQLDRAAGFYPAGSGFDSWRGHLAGTSVVRSPSVLNICLWILHFIFYPILGFGSARYQGQVVNR